MKLTNLTVTAFVLMLALSPGCRSVRQTQYLHKNADLGAIQKVAVLPFENLTQERSAADKVQKIFQMELLALDVFEVAEPGQVTKVLRAGGIATTEALGAKDFQRLGQDLGVDAVFAGTVVDYAETRTGSTPTPEVTIQVRLIETQTGATIWSTSHTRAGAGISTRLFGLGGESLTQATRRVVRTELATLLK
jgi:TolB-like protein